MDNKRMQEDFIYREAKKWLNENGVLTINHLENSQRYKVVFSNEKVNVELIGDDTIKLTIQIYNQVCN
jgi:hypothetical protein